MNTPTPRTDAKAWGFRRQTVGATESAIEWARELERDLADAQEALSAKDAELASVKAHAEAMHDRLCNERGYPLGECLDYRNDFTKDAP